MRMTHRFANDGLRPTSPLPLLAINKSGEVDDYDQEQAPPSAREFLRHSSAEKLASNKPRRSSARFVILLCILP